MRECPCKGCAERHGGCHASCQHFKRWKVINDHLLKREKIAREMNQYTPSIEISRAHWRMIKGKGWRIRKWGD